MEERKRLVLSDDKYEQVMTIVNPGYKYYMLSTINMIIVGIVGYLVTSGLTFNEIMPYVMINNNSILLTSTQCKLDSIQIDKEKSLHNWIIDFNLYCDSDMKIQFLGSFLGLGLLTGCILSFLIGNKYPPKKTMIKLIIMLSFILVLFISNIYHSLIWLYMCIFLFSTCSMCLLLFKINYIFEISNNSNRSYLLGITLSSSFLSLLVNLFLFAFIRDWFYVFVFFVNICIMTAIIISNTLPENPRHYLIKQDFEEFRSTIIDIGAVNNKKRMFIEEEFYKIINTGQELSTSNNIECEGLKNNSSYYHYHYYTNSDDIASNSVIGFIDCIKDNQQLLENFILFLTFQLFFPSLLAGSSLYIKRYYHSYSILFYVGDACEIMIRIIVSYFTNLIGRKTTKHVLICLLVFVIVASKLLDFKDVYMLLFIRMLVETISFVNLLHMLECFASTLRFRMLCLFAFVSKLGLFIFPSIFQYMSEELSLIIAIYSLIGMILNYLTTETNKETLMNFPKGRINK